MKTMTGKSRIKSLLKGEKTDRLSWTTRACDITRQNMGRELREMSVIDFYRTIGCDIFQQGNFALKNEERFEYPFTLQFADVKTRTENPEPGLMKTITRTKKGELVSIWKNGHPVKYPVETKDDFFMLLDLWSGADVTETELCPENYHVIDMIGDSGILIPDLPPSPIQHLIEYDLGLENFCYFMQDYPEEMDRIISEMHRCNLKEYEFSARDFPVVAVMAGENTSTTLISPELYKKYSMNHMRDFCDAMHKHGKLAIIHMCGHIRGLLPYIKETGLDGIDALTQPSVGNCPFEDALDVIGDDLIIIGTMDSTVFQGPTATREDIQRELDRMYTPRIRESRFLLWPVSDGLPTDLWRFEAIRDWFFGSQVSSVIVSP
jgi:hypothetical protein